MIVRSFSICRHLEGQRDCICLLIFPGSQVSILEFVLPQPISTAPSLGWQEGVGGVVYFNVHTWTSIEAAELGGPGVLDHCWEIGLRTCSLPQPRDSFNPPSRNSKTLTSQSSFQRSDQISLESQDRKSQTSVQWAEQENTHDWDLSEWIRIPELPVNPRATLDMSLH